MNHLRHSALFTLDTTSVSLIGCGGIGASTAVCLAKMGVPYMEIYDDDVVSDINLPTQLHCVDEIGELKVYALERLINKLSDETMMEPLDTRILSSTPLKSQFIISAVDSISARKDIWEAVKNGTCSWYLDARMAAESFHLHVVDMSDPKNYQWYDRLLSTEDDANVPDLPCTSKATFQCSMLSAAFIGGAVRKLAMGETHPRMLIVDMPTLHMTSIP